MIMKSVKEEEFYDVSLEIKDPGQEDAGQYKCNVKNKFGEINANLNLNIELAPEIKEAPRILKNEKKTVEIECVVQATSMPKFEWKNESAVIKEDSKHSVKVTETKKGEYRVLLKIEECTETDLGRYKLVAKNEKGEASSKQVEVKAEGKKPTFKKKLLGLNIEEGQAIDIECAIETPDQKSTIEWTRDSIVLVASSEIVMTFDGSVAHLHIEHATIEHAGQYMCVVRNQFGEAETVSKVEIEKKKEEKRAPSKPKGPLKVSDVTAKGLKLAWEKPEDDGGSPITGYVVEKMDKATGRWVPVGKTQGTALDVTGLSEGHDYEFRVKAVNEEGESEPLYSDKAIKAKNPYDPPGKPGKPIIDDWDVDRVDLKWDAPSNNGGAPITSYIIEAKDKVTSTWEELYVSDGPECNCRATDTYNSSQVDVTLSLASMI
jgi:hypothetical protein